MAILLPVIGVIVVILSALYMRYRFVPKSEVAAWLRGLGILLNSGMRIDHALDILARGCRSRRLARISLLVKQAVMEGEPLSRLLGRPDTSAVFGTFVPEAVRAAENEGNLPETLILLSEIRGFRRGRPSDPSDIDAEAVYGCRAGRTVVELPDRPRIDPNQQPQAIDPDLLNKALDDLREHQQPAAERRARRTVTLSTAPVPMIVGTLLREALRIDASEISLRPEGRERVGVYFRRGACEQIMVLPGSVAPSVCNEIKFLAGVQYWVKKRASTTFEVGLDGKHYCLTLHCEPGDAGEILRIDMPGKTVGG